MTRAIEFLKSQTMIRVLTKCDGTKAQRMTRIFPFSGWAIWWLSKNYFWQTKEAKHKKKNKNTQLKTISLYQKTETPLT